MQGPLIEIKIESLESKLHNQIKKNNKRKILDSSGIQKKLYFILETEKNNYFCKIQRSRFKLNVWKVKFIIKPINLKYFFVNSTL